MKLRVHAGCVGCGVIVGVNVRVLLGAVVALGPPGVWVAGVVGVLAGEVGETTGAVPVAVAPPLWVAVPVGVIVAGPLVEVGPGVPHEAPV